MLAKLRRRLQNQKGFTLIELLAVVTIIAVLAAFAVPKVMQAIANSKARTGRADTTTIGAALDQYFMDNNKYPATLSDLVVKGYIKQTTAFKNPYGQWYFYAVNDSTTPTAYILGDPGVNGNGSNTAAPLMYKCLYDGTGGACAATGNTPRMAPVGNAPNGTVIQFASITFKDNSQSPMQDGKTTDANPVDPGTYFNNFRTDVVTQ